MVEQIDSRTFRIDIVGPAKDGALRGVITARANRATRFNLTGGVRAGSTRRPVGARHGNAGAEWEIDFPINYVRK